MARQPRKRGTLLAQVTELWRANPSITGSEVSAQLKLSKAHGYTVLRKVKSRTKKNGGRTFAAPGSALDRVLGGKVALTREQVEQDFLTFVHYIGTMRAAELLTIEQEKLRKAMNR